MLILKLLTTILHGQEITEKDLSRNSPKLLQLRKTLNNKNIQRQPVKAAFLLNRSDHRKQNMAKKYKDLMWKLSMIRKEPLLMTLILLILASLTIFVIYPFFKMFLFQSDNRRRRIFVISTYKNFCQQQLQNYILEQY